MEVGDLPTRKSLGEKCFKDVEYGNQLVEKIDFIFEKCLNTTKNVLFVKRQNLIHI